MVTERRFVRKIVAVDGTVDGTRNAALAAVAGIAAAATSGTSGSAAAVITALWMSDLVFIVFPTNPWTL